MAAVAMDSSTTLDLLSGVSSSSCTSSASEIDHTGTDLKLDFEMSAPTGWEKRLDLKLGQFYFLNLSTGKRSYDHPDTLFSEQQPVDVDLKLNLGRSRSFPAPQQSGMSTIEAVEEALRRSPCPSRKRKLVVSTNSSTTSSSSSSGGGSRVTSENQFLGGFESGSTGFFPKVVLTGCKRCLMYVMLTRSDPRCPKCGTAVVVDIPLQQLPKKQKPRLELGLL